jgi:membrane protein DedA with SNARE-associated domain
MVAEGFNWIIATARAWGYPGIVIAMAIESTIIPLPSEFVLIPAGWLVAKGEMSAWAAVLAGAVGSLIGASINYVVSMTLGRAVVERICGYFLIKPEKLEDTYRFFARHGAFSTFVGRLIPGVRHLISIPAGLSRMNFPLFALYTTLGAALWSAVLVGLGYWAGANEDLWRPMLHRATLWLFGGVGVLIVLYVWRQRRQRTAD